MSRVWPGSSPLTRGKLPGPSTQVPDQRLIPAHAGKTHEAAGALGECRAHPRSRGENPASAVNLPSGRGSSPLTRGKRCVVGGDLVSDRLIPAHAGKTCRCRRAIRLRRAHPRSRGENARMSVAVTDSGGSSPLTRGKHPRRPPHRPRTGLIPAHAGKTETSTRSSRGAAAHPRSRGENRLSHP